MPRKQSGTELCSVCEEGYIEVQEVASWQDEEDSSYTYYSLRFWCRNCNDEYYDTTEE